VRAPIDEDGATCFAAVPQPRPFDEADTRALENSARRIAALSQQPEPEAARDARLMRIAALSHMLTTLKKHRRSA